jgi:hypothetical protein
MLAHPVAAAPDPIRSLVTQIPLSQFLQWSLLELWKLRLRDWSYLTKAQAITAVEEPSTASAAS